MAIDHTVWLYNQILHRDSGMYKYKLYSWSYFIPSKDILSNWHNWGDTTYVLEPKFQKGGSHIPKWARKSHSGIFLGFKRLHSTMVGLILNLHTRSISPQFHVVFDDRFTTVASAQNEEVVPKIWTNMITNPNYCLYVSLDEVTNSTLTEKWLSYEEVQELEAAQCKWIDQQHILCRDNKYCQELPDSTIR